MIDRRTGACGVAMIFAWACGSPGGSAGDAGADADASYARVVCDVTDVACGCVFRVASTPGPSPACPMPSLPHPVCCADPGYPQTEGSECGCTNVACSDTGQACGCFEDSTGKWSKAACGSYPYCCVLQFPDGTPGACACNVNPPSPGTCGVKYQAVPTCDLTRLTNVCRDGKVQVPACSSS